MVLYCTVHGANISRALIHKFRYHPDDEAVFIVDKDASSLYCPRIDKIKYYRMPDPYKIADDSWPVEKIKEQTNRTLSEFLQGIDVDPRRFSHAYILHDGYNPFALYFELNSIRYMSVEIDNGHLDVIAANPKLIPRFHDVVKELHLSDGCGKNCTKAYLFSDRSRHNVIDGKVEIEVYDYYGTLLGLDEGRKRQLIEGYGLEKYDFSAVMLLNSQAVSKRRVEQFRSAMPQGDAEDEYFSFYKTVIDYYFTDVDFAVKLHPETDEKVERVFSEFKQLPKEVPIEMFILLGKKFDVFCPALSSAYGIYWQNGYNVVCFGERIYGFIRQIHFVFLAFTLINMICPPPKIFTYLIVPEQLKLFSRHVYGEFKDTEFQRVNRDNIREALFILADEPDDDFMEMIKGARQDCLILFTGSRVTDERIFAKQEMIYSIIDVSGEKEINLRPCCWTVLSKNRELVKALSDFSVSYTLERSKKKIQTEPHN